MTDTIHEAPERIWTWGWRADSVWQEQTWQHEDEPYTMEYIRADLYTAVSAERGALKARNIEMEANTQAAMAGMEAALARAEKAEAELERVKKMRDQIVGDKINLRGELATMQAKVARLRKLLESWLGLSNHCSIEEGVCCCGDSMDSHSKAMDCGHMPLDHGTYIAGILEEKTRAALKDKPAGKDSDD